MDKLTVSELASMIARDTNQPIRRSLHCPGTEHTHGDKSPSLHVFESRADGMGRYKCHLEGCDVNGPTGKGGDSQDWERRMGRSQSLQDARATPRVPDAAREAEIARQDAATREQEAMRNLYDPGTADTWRQRPVLGPEKLSPAKSLARLREDLKWRLLRFDA